MTDKELVLRKLSMLRTHIARVVRRRPSDVEVLRAHEDLQDAIAMSLFVSLQEAIDIAFHIAADEGWGIPASNAESFTVLAEHDAIDKELAAKLAQTVKVRNRIAHGYASVDIERLWQEIPEGVAQLEDFATSIATWLETLP
jgi:uncharacterized protein YutE (UPF0331/DUF86 family)